MKDDYNLINSRTIGDYCSKIKYNFNTEELAVLVYRNKKMSIDEKISKYKELIEHYPDMEVIERINCRYYDSVKIMIQNEINRLKDLQIKLASKNKACIYTWIEYNKSTMEYDYRSNIKNTKKTFAEVYKDVSNYIEKYNDTISFKIMRKNLCKKEDSITAFYTVKNKKIKLVNIVEDKDEFLDIDNIFLNIPTPFKKGDILISNNESDGYEKFGEIFVLDYLCTWKEKLNELLKKGNYDSSDMVGYGYYLYRDSTKFVRDSKRNYDSFEYYKGEFTGNNRILKSISSFIKEKINLELFVYAYDHFKNDYKNNLADLYTDEGLKLAGFSKEDIMKTNQKMFKKGVNKNERNSIC